MKTIRQNLDFLGFVLVVAGFVFVAAQRLAEIPYPDSDEAMTLQVPYEMLNHGKLALPLYRFLGGNIENSWHSFTPVYFALLGGFMKIFGWGLLQGRVFNLITAVFVLLMLYLIARKLFDWRVALISVVLLISDPLFLARSRVVRNDLLAAGFGLLAFHLYEKAQDREAKWLYLGSGLAAGAGVMSHTNLIYILAVILVLMLLRDGWKVLTRGKPYQFAAGALAVMAYEIIYDVIDYRNLILQNREDNLHFRVLERWGWFHNLVAEPERYAQWFAARGARVVPGTGLLHVFLFLTVLALVYLLARSLAHLRRGSAMSDPRTRVFVATVVVALVVAVTTQRKVTQYVVHLAPWFALCAAVMLTDGWAAVRAMFERGGRPQMIARNAFAVVVALLISVYGYQLLKQNARYLEQVRDPERATFEPFKAALRSIVPDGVCPVSIASAYVWLAFPEKDQCYFAHMEARLDEALILDGEEYALIVQPKFESRLKKLTGAGFKKYHLLGELDKTPYGTFNIYYTGNDQQYLALAPRRYYFFGRRRGYASDEQIAEGREVWAADAAQMSRSASSVDLRPEPDDVESPSDKIERSRVTNLCAVELDPNKIYQVRADASYGGDFELLVLDDVTGGSIQRVASSDADGQRRLEALFRTSNDKRIRLAIRISGEQTTDPPLGRISIREIGPV
jgi:4-amino-4-deoxy-L-arabinose transferase-like glycosyltransferase